VDLFAELIKQVIVHKQHSSLDTKCQHGTETPTSGARAAESSPSHDDGCNVTLDSAIMEQLLRQFITSIAALRENDSPFWNFEHASHVVLAAKKLIHPSTLHEHDQWRPSTHGTDGIAVRAVGRLDDAVRTQFALLLAALVHAVDGPSRGDHNGTVVDTV
jgi:hypothetical protein